MAQPRARFDRSHHNGRDAVADQIHHHLFKDAGEPRQRFRPECGAQLLDGHAVIVDPIIGLSRLEPASAAVPAAAEKQQNEDEDDEKCCLIHIGLRG